MNYSSPQIAIVLYPGFTALDVIGPYEVLKYIPGAEVRFVAHAPGPIPNDRGQLIIAATHSFDETTQPDIIVVPGSEANTPVAMADSKLIAWLLAVHETSTVTASVCSGSLVLAAAGLLRGIPATTHWFAMPFLKRFGALAKPNERIVREGRIFTSAGVSAGIDLALHIVEELSDRTQAEVIQLSIEYDPQPHIHSGHTSKATDDVLKRATDDMKRLSQTPMAFVALSKLAWKKLLNKARAKSFTRIS